LKCFGFRVPGFGLAVPELAEGRFARQIKELVEIHLSLPVVIGMQIRGIRKTSEPHGQAAVLSSLIANSLHLGNTIGRAYSILTTFASLFPRIEIRGYRIGHA